MSKTFKEQRWWEERNVIGRERRWDDYTGVIPSNWRRLRRRKRKAKDRNALRAGLEPLRHRKNDVQDYF